MKSLVLIAALALIPLTGCATRNLAASLKELGDDPAIVVGSINTVYGTAKLVRIGVTTNSVTVNPDGTVTVNK